VPIIGADGGWGGGFIITCADSTEMHPASLATVNVYVPWGRFVIVVLLLVPFVTTLSGRRVRVHVPVDGKPFKTTLPVNKVQVMLLIGPMDGAEGMAFTTSVYVATAAEQGAPRGLSVVNVMITVLPKSPAAGVYVNENGEVFIED
jgi:hypothetical protein